MDTCHDRPSPSPLLRAWQGARGAQLERIECRALQRALIFRNWSCHVEWGHGMGYGPAPTGCWKELDAQVSAEADTAPGTACTRESRSPLEDAAFLEEHA